MCVRAGVSKQASVHLLAAPLNLDPEGPQRNQVLKSTSTERDCRYRGDCELALIWVCVSIAALAQICLKLIVIACCTEDPARYPMYSNEELRV